MRHNEIATGRHGSLQLVYDPIGIVIISDEMQDGDEQDSNRLIQIDEGLQGRMPDDLTGIAQITVNCNGQGILDEKGLRVRYHDRIIINVQDARVRLKATAVPRSFWGLNHDSWRVLRCDHERRAGRGEVTKLR